MLSIIRYEESSSVRPQAGVQGNLFILIYLEAEQQGFAANTDYYPDAKEFFAIGIQPDIVVKKQIQDFISGKDAVLAKALEMLSQ